MTFSRFVLGHITLAACEVSRPAGGSPPPNNLNAAGLEVGYRPPVARATGLIERLSIILC